MKRILGIAVTLCCLLFLSPGCYTLKSESIPPEMKTINVGFFENNAALVVANLSQQFTEALKDRIRTTTRLSIVTSEGDARMSGAITDYRIAPVSIQATPNSNTAPIAGASVLSITVSVKFVYTANPKLSFDQTFTKTMNFTGDIAATEQNLIQAIDKQLIDDVFNRAFNNW
jgi:hypothetical protein